MKKNHIITSIRILFLLLFFVLLKNDKLVIWLILFGASLLLAPFFGRIYCGYICPMNTVMIPTDSFAKKLKLKTDKTPKWLSSGNFAWFTLFISIGVFIFTRKVVNKNFPVLIVWLVLSVLITLRYKTSIFHNLICPFGKLQESFGKFAQRSHKVDIDKCIGCKLCEKVCPNESVVVDSVSKKANIDPALCLQCSNCEMVCPTKAIAYTKNR